MKIFAMDTVIDQLKAKETAELFGNVFKETSVIVSLEQKGSFAHVGSFYRNVDTHPGNAPFFTFEDGKLVLSQAVKDGRHELIEVDPFNYMTDFTNRISGIVDNSTMQEKTVTVIGAGSNGGAVILDLVRCGFANINVIEFDTISVSNVCRSVYNITDIGRKKAEVIREKALAINPFVNINVYDEDILTMDTEKLTGILQSSDIVIEGTDNIKSKLLVNGLAKDMTVVLYPAVYDMGKGGDILITMPGLPCYACVFASILDEMKQAKRRAWDYASGKVKPMASLISDIQVVVARTVKIAVAILNADKDESMFEKITEEGCTLLLISNQLGGAPSLDGTFREKWVPTNVDSNCICRTLC